MAFGEPGPVLVVTEGIETALALRTACPGLPAAATLAPANLPAFTPPANLSLLVIARDNGAASARAAARLLRRCRPRVRCEILVPRLRSLDDDLLERGPEALAARIRALTARRERP